MSDYYLKAIDEATMNAALVAAGLAYEETTSEQTGKTKAGKPIMKTTTVLYPAPFVSLDIIGPITKYDYSVEPPVPVEYPEWHVNVRSYDLTEEQLAQLANVMIVPPNQPYRVWA